jgi:hypothetical protein
VPSSLQWTWGLLLLGCSFQEPRQQENRGCRPHVFQGLISHMDLRAVVLWDCCPLRRTEPAGRSFGARSPSWASGSTVLWYCNRLRRTKPACSRELPAKFRSVALLQELSLLACALLLVEQWEWWDLLTQRHWFPWCFRVKIGGHELGESPKFVCVCVYWAAELTPTLE